MSEQRPFYMIAHRCNDVSHIRKAMNRGFNALEIDLRMKDSDTLIVDHDKVYSWSTRWSDWLATAEALPQALKDRLALLMLDIKAYKPELVEKLRSDLRNSSLGDVPLTFSVANIDAAKKTFTPAFLSSLRANETIDISYFEDPADVLAWMNTTPLPKGKGWYGDGINKVGIGHSQAAIDKNLEAARAIRAQGGFAKVYSWTYEKNASVKAKILEGCDGLVVNTGSSTRGSGEDTYYKWALDYEKIMEETAATVKWATKADF